MLSLITKQVGISRLSEHKKGGDSERLRAVDQKDGQAQSEQPLRRASAGTLAGGGPIGNRASGVPPNALSPPESLEGSESAAMARRKRSLPGEWASAAPSAIDRTLPSRGLGRVISEAPIPAGSEARPPSCRPARSSKRASLF